jgi:peptidoglycan DL-endopeptidase CwlO
LASHRKPRSTKLHSAATRSSAVGITALASVGLLTQSASASPGDKPAKPSVKEVKKRVDALYHQAEADTQKYNAAKEKTDFQRAKVDRLLDQVAARAADVNDARRVLGEFATAQYRSGSGLSPTATLLLAHDPQGYFTQQHVMARLTRHQQHAVQTYRERQQEAQTKRREATDELSTLAASQKELRGSKEAVQHKLSEARDLLSRLTAQQKARMAALERKQKAAAAKKAEAEARQSGGGTSSSGTAPAPSSRAAQAVAFAKAQLGKPYVWGATGPSSYDCSGLTQAAWRAAGVALPRTTYDQVNAGTPVSEDRLQPGDLVFFYSDVSHVGIYVGNGKIIHAPKPGDVIQYAPMDWMPFHSAVRPG